MIAVKISKAAELLNTDKGTIYDAINSGELKMFYIGQGKKGTQHVMVDDLKEWCRRMIESEGKE